VIRKLWSRLARALWSLPSSNNTASSGMRTRPATYVGGGLFLREELSSVIDDGGDN
jgi:hypothetical protein